MEEKFISCPFCKEDDFDLEGLKGHLLNGYCEEFNVIEVTTSLFRRWRNFEEINESAKKCCGFKE